MEQLKVIGKRILIILAIAGAILAVGFVGQLDHDEYIEVNSTPKTRMPYWYE